jgi:uncharacterized protein (TIGR02246 family)
MQVFTLIISIIALFILLMSWIKVGQYPDIKPKPIDTSYRHDDLSAIQNLVDIMIEGWKTGDANLYTSAFAERHSYIAFNGERFTNTKENIDAHIPLFTKYLRGSELVNQRMIDINFIAEDAAVVIISGSIKPKHWNKPPKSRASIQTLVAQKKEGTWKFAAFQNSRIIHFSMLDIIKMIIS